MKTNIRTQALFDGVGGIEDAYIEEARNFTAVRRTHGRLFRFAAVAASIALLIGCICFRDTANPDAEPKPYFVLTAYADNGVDTSISNAGDVMNVASTFDSGSEHMGLFGDHMTFSFKIILDSFVNQPVKHSEISLEIAYDDKTGIWRDEHIQCAHVIPLWGHDSPFGYAVWGWFDEPTQLELLIKHKTGEIIQYQKIEIIPLDDSYDIKVIELYINEHY